jgi:N-acetylglucosamine-6-sulfatase
VKPSIVVVLTDDQRWDTLWAMPTLQRELVARGVTFTNAFVDDPLCCPSRSSILTGRYVHTTGVWSNQPPLGGFPRFDDSSTIATWLHGAGYRTALVGKYLNRYEGTYVPPGWDRWVAFSGAGRESLYLDYSLNIDGAIERFGRGAGDYSTDVLAREATSFIRRETGPIFLYLAPFAPHPPSTVDRSDRGSFSDLEPWRPPSYDEADVSDKPAWVRGLGGLGSAKAAKVDALRRRAYGSLQAVDRAIGEVVDALADTGRLDHTLILFTSDNGYSWGEHGWADKMAPYEEDIRVPFVIRYDPLVRAPRDDDHLVVNVDVAPTLAALAGVDSPGDEGRDLLPLLRGDDRWRDDFLIEAMRVSKVPGYCGVRSEGFVYVVYQTGEEELYDLSSDPYQLLNRASDPALIEERQRMRNRLHELCAHPPPGFASPP